MRSIMYVICIIIGHIFAKVTYFFTNLPSGILIFNSSRASVFKKENFCLRILIERTLSFSLLLRQYCNLLCKI